MSGGLLPLFTLSACYLGQNRGDCFCSSPMFLLLNEADLTLILDTQHRYTDPKAYNTFKSLLTNEYKRLHRDQGLNKQNLRNLQSQYRLTTSLHPLVQGASQTKGTRGKSFQKFLDWKYSFPTPKSKNLSITLNSETKHIANYLEAAKDPDEKDEISMEIERLKNEKAALSHDNCQALRAYTHIEYLLVTLT